MSDSDNTDIEISPPTAKKRKILPTQPSSSQQSSSSQNILLDTRKLPSRIAKGGRISKIHLINFMCHKNFVIDFNEQINIFVGSNGSGKSAIITSLVVGLGGNAALTERSSRLSQLIRRGETAATIEIELLNDGFDPYEEEKFGKRITVVRHITAAGASSYKIKDVKGNVVSKSVKDLHKILMYFNIQVDNPICVLNQDAARTFLKEADEKKRYVLFLKSTQIENILEKLDEATQTYNLTVSHLKVFEKQVEKNKSNHSLIKEKYDRLLSVESLKEELYNLKIELLWNKVCVEEAKCKEIEINLNQFRKKIEQIHNKIKNRNEQICSLKETKNEISRKIESIQKEYTEKKNNYDSVRNSFTERSNQLAGLERQCKINEAKLKRLQNDRKELEKAIEGRSGNAIEELKQKNENKLRKLLLERDSIKIMEENSKKDLELLKSNIEQMQNILEDLRDRRKDASLKETQLTAQIRQIDVKSNNTLNVYGNDMPRLIEALEKQYKRGTFSEMPRGPIGRYIEVPKAKWRPLAEHILGGMLQFFCFNTNEDSRKFDQMIRRDFSNLPKINKIVSKFCHKPYDLKKGRVIAPPNTIVLIDALKVSDPVVLNILIDQLRIEVNVLTEKSTDAQYYTSKIENVPKRLSRMYSIEPCAVYLPAPSYRSYGAVLRPNRFLQTNLKDYKETLEQQLQQISNELEVYNADWVKNQNEIAKLTNSMKQKRDQLIKIEDKIRNLQNEIMVIKNTEYPVVHEVDVLVAELNEIKNSYDETQVKLNDAKTEYELFQSQVKEVEKQLVDVRKEIKIIENLLQEKNQRLSNISEEIKDMENNNMDATLKKVETEKNQVDQLHRAKSDDINNLISVAEASGNRIDNGRSVNEIERAIKSCERKINTTRDITENITDIQEQMKEMEKNYLYSVKVLQKSFEVVRELESSRIRRYKWLNRYKQGISLVIRSVFLRLLKLRSFRGDLIINNSDKVLKIEIIPQDKDVPNAVSNTKSLSGGERSFSTLAFLLSLWSCVSQPFYFLDEYDVFTDEVNRVIMANLLMTEAKRRQDRQFCFFTPQDMSFIDESPDITFHRLSDHLTTIE